MLPHSDVKSLFPEVDHPMVMVAEVILIVDARDAATTFQNAMKKGRHGERYLLGAANWTFSKFFGRLERLTKVSAPRLALPSKLAQWTR